MTAKRRFHTMQTDLHEGRWMGLSFGSFMDSEDPNDALRCPIIGRVCGDEIEYGKLFAYCFRRFGYPERGWDNYKELVTYYLTTPHQDMVLTITPYVGNTSLISMGFLVKSESLTAIEDYARRDRTAWEQRMLDWAEKQGLPDWMQEWIEIYNTEYCAAFTDMPKADNWRQIVNFAYPLGEEGSRPYELTNRVVEFRKKLHADYSKTEPWPTYYIRPANVQDWNDDDPLKPFALAALGALEDLHSPVGVRDQSINAFGEVESSRVGVKAASSAGYPSGALGNSAAKELAELHELIMKLGKGNAKRGIKKVLRAITVDAETSR